MSTIHLATEIEQEVTLVDKQTGHAANVRLLDTSLKRTDLPELVLHENNGRVGPRIHSSR
jgi:hypothetical protein